MRNLLFFILLICSGCNGNSLKEKELNLKEKELELREKELKNKENSVSTLKEPNANTNISHQVPEIINQPIIHTSKKKFIYIILKSKQPTLLTITNEQKYVTDAGGFSTPIGDRFSYETIMETNYYTSEVIEVSDYTKDKQFMLMDKFEFQIINKMEEYDRSYKFDVDTKTGLDKQSYYDYKSYIADRKCYVFDTYEEASIHSRGGERNKFN